jgi:prevent-host-death family protein
MTKHEIRMPAGEFKARCLQLMAEVERTRRPVTITKRGRPVARLVPVDTEATPFLGALRSRIRIAGDITKPTESLEVWETEKEWIDLCRDNPPR